MTHSPLTDALAQDESFKKMLANRLMIRYLLFIDKWGACNLSVAIVGSPGQVPGTEFFCVQTSVAVQRDTMGASKIEFRSYSTFSDLEEKFRAWEWNSKPWWHRWVSPREFVGAIVLNCQQTREVVPENPHFQLMYGMVAQLLNDHGKALTACLSHDDAFRQRFDGFNTLNRRFNAFTAQVYTAQIRESIGVLV